MIRLLIADDEPLVQIGIKSMLDWASFGIEICGIASNGQDALAMIEKYSAQIVITDIKMPIMDGLQLMQECRNRYGSLPLFIVLTSYEEFHLAKQAVSLQAIDYLVKLELSEAILANSIRKAIGELERFDSGAKLHDQPVPVETLLFHERFFIMLLNNLFENEEQFHLQAKDLSLNFDAAGFQVAYMEIVSPKSETMSTKQQMSFFSSVLQMVKTLLTKYIRCYITPLDIRHFAIIFLISGNEDTDYTKQIRTSVENSAQMLHKYYGASIYGVAGRRVDHPLDISASFQDARQIFSKALPEKPLLFFEEQQISAPVRNIFNMAIFKNEIVSAFEELDAEHLKTVFSSITDLFRENPSYFLQALDAASSILYLSISLLTDGEELVSNIFADNPQKYRCLFTLNTTEQILQWLNTLFQGLYTHFESRRKDYKNQIVANAKLYIRNNYAKKLSLNEVAAALGVSPNYLSSLFGKYSDCGFVDYVNQIKIHQAREMMTDQSLKIQDIAEQLGFDNAFYFSKVFKKVEGCSPREYLGKRGQS
ncbi:MAG: AraC family transcriptional regulator [Ruminiclostridium sp.]|nr:AraC family transcriptional regulator [Ruminiclostridium sp.]